MTFHISIDIPQTIKGPHWALEIIAKNHRFGNLKETSFLLAGDFFVVGLDVAE